MSALLWPATVLVLGLALVAAAVHAWRSWLKHRERQLLDAGERNTLEQGLHALRTKQAADLDAMDARVVRLENRSGLAR